MANEAAIINNPDSVPAAVSTGYQLQNTGMVAARTGMDATAVTGGTGECVLEISGPVDVNGVLYSINSQVTFALTVAGTYYIHLAGSGSNLTPTIGTGANTFDPDKNARYTDTGSYRVLNWVVYFDGVTATAVRLLTPESDENIIRASDVVIETATIETITVNPANTTKVLAYLSGAQTINSNNPTKIAFNSEYFDTQSEFNVSTNTFTAKKAGYYLVSGIITLSGADQDQKKIFLYKDGSQYPSGCWMATTTIGSSVGAQQSFNFTIVVYLDANGTISLYADSDNYNPYAVTHTGTFLSITSLI